MNSLFGNPPQKESHTKSHFLTLLGLGLAVLSLWTRKELLPLWISIAATILLALGIFYVYFEVLTKWFHGLRHRWLLCHSVDLLKPRLLDFLSVLARFLDRERIDCFIRIVDEINQLRPLQERRLSVGETAHLYTLGRFVTAVRSQVSAMRTGQDLIASAQNAYTVFSDYNTYVGQVHNKLRQAIYELSQTKSNGQDRRAEDDAIRTIRTKWNSFRDRQNAHVDACLQLGEELRHTEQIHWGNYIEHFETLE